MQAPPSTMAGQSTSSLSLDDQDENVRIAVRALGAMRNSTGVPPLQSQVTPIKTSSQPTPALSIASSTSSTTSTSLPSPSLSPLEDVNSPDFVSRVSHLPLVGTALRAYEQGKASSRVVKYGAEMMESSVKTISRPVIDRLPVNVNQLDEFACRQLDRFDKYRHPSEPEPEHMRIGDRDRSEEPAEYDDSESWSTGLQTRDASTSSSQSRSGKRKEVSSWDAADGTYVQPPSQEPPESEGDDSTGAEQNQQVAQRSRWQAVLLEAGGISAALSEESMRRLKYCLQWLQYATTHIDGQILVLRDFTASLQSSANNPSALISPQHLRTLTDVRRDVVQTIRQVVDVVSKYAGGALPEPARSRVRGFILHLPQRWASAAQGEGVAKGAGGGAAVGGVPVGNGTRRGRGSRYQHHRERGSGSRSGTPASSGPASPLASPRAVPRREIQVNGHGHATAGILPSTAGGATQAAQRILTLSTESLDMMRGVTAVVKESLDRAEAWVERLRVVGVQRQQQQQQPEPQTHQPFRVPSGPSTPAFSERSYGFDFPSPAPGSSSSWSSPPTPGAPDAPSPGALYGLGGLTLGAGAANTPSSTNATPRNGLKNLPEEQHHQQMEAGVGGGKEGKVEVAVSKQLSESSSTTSKCDPEAARMDVDT